MGMKSATDLALQAYEARPNRAEALYELAKHFRERGMNHVAMLFAEPGLRMPYPKDDLLFVEDAPYRYGFAEEVSIAGFYSERHREQAAAICDALVLDRGVPQSVHDQAWNNLFFYTRPLSEVAPSFTAKRIEFEPPDGYRPCNPSICRLVDRMILNVRAVNYLIGDDGRYVMREPEIKTRNFLFHVKQDLEVVFDKELAPELGPVAFRGCLGIEDVRLFPWGNGLWFSATTRQRNTEGWCEIHVGATEAAPELRWIRPPGPRRAEKNWMPVADGSGRFVYSCDPTLVLNFEGEKHAEHAPSVAAAEWGGSSQLIPFDDGFLCLVHERQAYPDPMRGQRNYQRRFVWFDKDFHIRKASRRFFFGDGEGEFCCGMCMHPDGERLVISYGVLDRQAWLATIRADEVRALLGMEKPEREYPANLLPRKVLDHFKRDEPRVQRYETATGIWWLPTDAPNDATINEIKAGRVYDAAVVEEARKHIKPGGVVLDLGANFGQMSVLFSRMVGPEGRVYAFEADPFICGLLRKNVDENGATNVIVIEAAVWDVDSEKLPYPTPDFKRFKAYGSYGIDRRGVADSDRFVPSMTIDSFNFTVPVSFMKVDVQGSDLRALRGARETIQKHRMPIIYEHEALFDEEFGVSFRDYEEFVESIGYTETAVIGGVNHVVEPRRAARNEYHHPLRYNRPLLSMGQVEAATGHLDSWDLPHHHDKVKNWDTWLALCACMDIGRDAAVMDAGGDRNSAFLPGLQKLGFKNLANVNLEERTPGYVAPIYYVAGDITKLGWVRDGSYAFVACLSVIEHGVDVGKFLDEMARIIRPGGKLCLSFDYWEDPINCGERAAFGAAVKIFERSEVAWMVRYAADVGLNLREGDLDLLCRDRVVNWIGLDFTFMCLLFERAGKRA